jgi:hypothetical protein
MKHVANLIIFSLIFLQCYDVYGFIAEKYVKQQISDSVPTLMDLNK